MQGNVCCQDKKMLFFRECQYLFDKEKIPDAFNEDSVWKNFKGSLSQ